MKNVKIAHTMTLLFAFVLTSCVGLSYAAIKEKRRGTISNPYIRAPQKIERDLNDPNLDTITVTNRNIGNFKKGFAGQNTASTVSSNPFYKLDVMAKSGSQGITSISNAVSLNGSGNVLFTGGAAVGGRALFISALENSPRSILNSSGGTLSSYTWGTSGDITAAGDYDNDAKADVAVYRPSDNTFYILKSSTGGTQTNTWGVAGDAPVAGDFDGDGQTDIAVRRPSTGEWFINRSTAGYVSVTWGVGTDTAVHADYDGDQKDDVAVWRPSTGEWFILRSTDGGFTQATWGASGDVPVPGDYDGDGRADISVVRNGVWHISQSTDGYRTATWGVGTDIAIPGRY